jgi:DNA helicase-2/ATP-dependent DNA helicase PcrA
MDIQLNKEQKSAVEHKGGPLLIIAGAGTGKTAVITQRIIHLINSGAATPDQILALTFTEKAADEMIERVDMAMPIGYDHIEISTFHSFCDGILRQEGCHIGIDSSFNLMSQAQSYILFRKHLFNFPLQSLRPLGNPTSNIGDILKHFSRLQDEDISPEEYTNYTQNLDPKILKSSEIDILSQLSETYKAYTDLKLSESQMDFGDLIITTLTLFRRMPHILEKYHNQYKYILVDEYQDTNYTQNVLVNMIALGTQQEKATNKKREAANITVVGDDDQAIYKFRGAAVSNILQFNEVYPTAKKVVLVENYRSKQDILDASYELIQNNNPNRLEISEGIDKSLRSRFESRLNLEFPIQLKIANTGEDESEFIAKEILKLTGNKELLKDDNSIVESQYDSDGQSMFIDVDNAQEIKVKFSDIAVLVRANAHLDSVTQALKYYGIPFKMTGPKGLYFRPEIQFLISYLKVIADYSSDIDMFNLLKNDLWNLEAREIVDLMQYSKSKKISIFEALEELLNISLGRNDADLEVRIKTNIEQKMFSEVSSPNIAALMGLIGSSFIQVKEGYTVGEVLYEFFTKSGYLQMLLEEDSYESQFKIKNISKYFDLIKSYEESSPNSRVIDYVEYLNYSIDIGENPKVDQDMLEDLDAVSLLTVHSSKGLEFPIVFMTNLAADRFPTKSRSDKFPLPGSLVKENTEGLKSGREAHLAEERRLFYVGVTRAKEKLYLSYAKSYSSAKRLKKPSLYIGETLSRSVDNDNVTNGNGQPPKFSVQVSSYTDSLDIQDLGLENIEKISYSHISTYESCPKQYKYRYLLGLPGPSNPALSFGRTMHDSLYDFYLRSGQGESITQEDLLDIYSSKWISEGYENKQHEEIRKKRGSEILKEFYKIEEEIDSNPILLEKWFKYKIEDIIVTGSIDRVDKVGEEDGYTIVDLIDYKTGKIKEDKEVQKNLQLAIYTVVAEELLGFKVRYAGLYFIEHNKRIDIVVSDELKNEAKVKIIDSVKNIRSGNYDPNPGFMCKFCDYKNICEDAIL